MIKSKDDGLDIFRGFMNMLLIYGLCACVIALFVWFL